ncbi:hypothetical protein HYE59_09310 [Aggregatibacter actinomycetemcomitans]|uniref:type VI secretion system amidase effector protein Tae4 n=1 Tax=Aggregatibacter actinomycetemcomitans TaxID=714 RepID=UPI00197B410B|nr:type VI secretion system amidase effector protein Tae4 [Aggregatibacter actinomycetemcomitans]MBN6075550.1 hypothetical protein [Aggregatibacter actinomycetemcomitans]MBN6077724.1 hypothetical protein [Aggregatibacter actinomycetemcomitans]
MGRDIKVRAGNQKRTLHIKRPSWNDMVRHYKTIPSREFYPIISKEWAALAENPKTRVTWENTCAGRMSYALNHSGFILPKNTKGAFIGDNDKFNHWFRVSELREYLKKSFGKGDFEDPPIPMTELTPSQEMWNKRVNGVRENMLNKIKNKTGIVVFEVGGWDNATGHFTLWNGNRLLYADGHDDPRTSSYYFWFFKSDHIKKRIVQTTKIIFWELK